MDEPPAGPAGAVYAVATDPQTITVFESDGQRRREWLRLPTPNSARFELLVNRSPDGQHLAYVEGFDGRYGRRAVVVAAGGREVLARDGHISDLAWAPDSQSLALLERLDVDSPQPAPPRLVVLGLDGSEAVTPLRTAVERLLGFTPDGREIYAVRPAGTNVERSWEVLVRIRPETGEIADLLGTGSQDGPHVGFRLIPTGQPEPTVAYVRKGDGPYEIVAARPDGREAVVLARSESYPGAFAVSPNLSGVAFANHDGLWVAQRGREEAIQVLPEFDPTWRLEAFDPDVGVWMRHHLYGYALLAAGEGKGLPDLTGRP